LGLGLDGEQGELYSSHFAYTQNNLSG